MSLYTSTRRRSSSFTKVALLLTGESVEVECRSTLPRSFDDSRTREYSPSEAENAGVSGVMGYKGEWRGYKLIQNCCRTTCVHLAIEGRTLVFARWSYVDRKVILL